MKIRTMVGLILVMLLATLSAALADTAPLKVNFQLQAQSNATAQLFLDSLAIAMEKYEADIQPVAERFGGKAVVVIPKEFSKLDLPQLNNPDVLAELQKASDGVQSIADQALGESMRRAMLFDSVDILMETDADLDLAKYDWVFYVPPEKKQLVIRYRDKEPVPIAADATLNNFLILVIPPSVIFVYADFNIKTDCKLGQPNKCITNLAKQLKSYRE